MRPIFALILLVSACLCSTNGGVSVPTANTPVRLSSTSVKCTGVAVQAVAANSGKICVGTSSSVTCSLSATPTSTDGVVLNAGDSYAYMPQANTFPYDLSQIWVVGTASTQGVTFQCQ